MSGTKTGPAAAALRAALAIIAPGYALATTARNKAFDAGLRRIRRLPRPVLSVGNITAGGTGKTPMIRWLAARLREDRRRVAILSRGYGARAGGLGDELTMLGNALNAPGSLPVVLHADPDRFAGGQHVLREHPEVEVFLLDDGFQHRRLGRDLDIVLIDATNPFGYGHVLPRGLLREPLGGLRRADAIVLTRCDRIDGEAVRAIETTIRRFHANVPIHRSAFELTGFRESVPPAQPPEHPVQSLAWRSWYVISGIGNPDNFRRQLESCGGRCVGSRSFADHHAYTAEDLQAVERTALAAGADVVVTTEKDWVKIQPLSYQAALPVWRADVDIHFQGDGQKLLLGQIRRVL